MDLFDGLLIQRGVGVDPWMNSDVLQRFDDERRTKNDERLMNFKGLLGLILEEWMYGFQDRRGLILDYESARDQGAC